MHIILGGTGRVGSATARALLRRGAGVTVVTRNAGNASTLASAGAKVAVADIRDARALRDVFRTGTRAFILSPPADPAMDTDSEERANVAAILSALEDSGLQKVVAASTYGARPGQPCGDLNVLHELEEGLSAQEVPAAVNRGAYYMSNWEGLLPVEEESGKLPSFFPADLKIPMVSPEDLGEAAAERLLAPTADVGVRFIEGPERYSPSDVAQALSDVLGKLITVEVAPRESWHQTFRDLGFSAAAAQSYACMTAAVVDGQIGEPPQPHRGATTLEACLREAVRGSGSSKPD